VIKEAIFLMGNLMGFDGENDARILTMQNEGDMPLGKVKMTFRGPRKSSFSWYTLHKSTLGIIIKSKT
jgi:hypothetical protein